MEPDHSYFKMEQLLLKWGFDELIIQNFLEHDIEVAQLRNLNDDYIRELVPKIGDRIKLKNKIMEFTNTTQTESSIENNVKKSSKNIRIEKILTRYGEGKKVLEFFSKKKLLLTTHKNYITRCLVDYYIEHFCTMCTRDFSKLADEIFKQFPGETKETYFVPGKTVNGKKIPHKGKLVDRYYNSKRNLDNKGKRKATATSTVTSTATSTATSDVSNMQSEEVNADEMKKCKDILHYQQIYSEENVEMWNKSIELRRCEFLAQDGSKIGEIFNNWPILRTSFATKLIECDFETIFPLKSRCVFDKWKTFSNGIEQLFYEIKDQNALKIVQKLINGSLTPESYNFYLLYLLPFIVKPTKNIIVKGTAERPSIAESRDSFIVKVNTINNLQVHIDAYVKLQQERGLIVKPLIIGVGNDEISDVFVVCDTVKYKCLSVTEALSVLFQLHSIFNISFSDECIQIWTLIRKFFFSIDNDSDLELTTVNSVLATLNTVSLFE